MAFVPEEADRPEARQRVSDLQRGLNQSGSGEKMTNRTYNALMVIFMFAVAGLYAGSIVVADARTKQLPIMKGGPSAKTLTHAVRIPFRGERNTHSRVASYPKSNQQGGNR